MLTFFIEPYSDELFYSIIARYHRRSGNLTISKTLQQLFGSNQKRIRKLFPSNLKHLCAQLPNNLFTTEDFIMKNTIFPVFIPFISKETRDKCYEIMENRSSTSVENILMKTSLKSLKPRYFKVCHDCIIQDREMFGEAYFHRTHQIPGIYICHKHNTPLHEIINKSDREEFIFLDDSIETVQVIEGNDLNPHIKLKDFMLDFLKADISSYDIDLTHKKYTIRMQESNYLTSEGLVRQKELKKDLLAFYTKDFLKAIQSDVNDHENPKQSNWIQYITLKKNYGCDPIRHLIFIKFLFGTIENFLRSPTQYLWFGVGPWKCLNPVAAHYKSRTIQEHSISTTYEGLKRGTFTCKCGFSYIRIHDGKDNEDEYRYINNFGGVWEEVFREKIESRNYNLKELANIMDCSVSTVVRRAQTRGLLQYLDTNQKKYCKTENNLILQEEKEKMYKDMILKLLSEEPSTTRSQIAKYMPVQYRWLQKYCKKWVEEIFPKPLISNLKENRCASRINWMKKDKELREKVEGTINEMIQDKEKRRISVYAIKKKIGYEGLDRALDKLPLTKKLLLEHIESEEEFQKRKIQYAIESFNEQWESLSAWKILKKAGVSKHYKEMHLYVRSLIDGL
ncbi:MAG: TnsD family Tn7-like transposition protein [Bacillota bacterium]